MTATVIRQTRNPLILTAFLTAVFMMKTDVVHAQDLGDIFTNVVEQGYGTFGNALTSLAYIAGLFLSVSGVMKFKYHVDSPGNVPISDAVKRLLSGGMFLALPAVMTAAFETVDGGGTVSRSSALATGGGGGATLDAMVISIMSDVNGPFAFALSAFCYLGGVIFILLGISRLVKTAQDGPRGPLGLGTIFCFLIGGALMNFNSLLGGFTYSLFGDGSIATNVKFTADVNAALGAGAGQAKTVVEAVMAFIILVGLLAFARGLFVLKAFADGTGNATVAQGLTFLFGGALAVNLGDLINAIQQTLGITAFGLTFS
jgi:hypothetical protein